MQSPISIKPSPKTPATLWHIRVWQMPMPSCQYGGTPSEDYPKSNAAARKALELDATLAHPHAVLGSNEMDYDWDFAGGEAEFKKAFELDPNDATAHQWYAADIGHDWWQGAGSPC